MIAIKESESIYAYRLQWNYLVNKFCSAINPEGNALNLVPILKLIKDYFVSFMCCFD